MWSILDNGGSPPALENPGHTQLSVCFRSCACGVLRTDAAPTSLHPDRQFVSGCQLNFKTFLLEHTQIDFPTYKCTYICLNNFYQYQQYFINKFIKSFKIKHITCVRHLLSFPLKTTIVRRTNNFGFNYSLLYDVL